MDTKKEKLWRSTGDAHSKIQNATFDLENIARDVEYLHPKLADDLWMLAEQIESARKTIQGNDSELLNLDLTESQRQMGEIFIALLDKAVD